MPGPWVLISPAGVRHLIKDRSETIEFAGESEQKALKMTSSNLLGYLGESNSSTASKKPAQHIKQWQLESRLLTLQRVDTGEKFLVFGDADHFLKNHRAPGMEALDKTKLQSLLNGNYKSHGGKTDVYCTSPTAEAASAGAACACRRGSF